MPDAPTNGCQVCSAPAGDDAYLCRTHTDDLASDLAAVVGGLLAELDITLTRQDRVTVGGARGRNPERPLPLNLHASEVASNLNSTLNAWALDVARIHEDERDRLANIHYSDTAEVAAWLSRNLATLRLHSDAGQAHNEITHAIREARRAIDRPLDYMPLGECGSDHLEEPCTTVVYGHPERQYAVCRGCGSRHRISDRLEWMLEHLRGQLVTLPEAVGIAYLAGKRTTEDKLRLMASRNRFPAVGVTADGKPTYRMADVLRALDERYKHRKNRAA